MDILKRIVLFPLAVFVVVGSFFLMLLGSSLAMVLMAFGIPFRKSHNYVGAFAMGLCPRLTLSRFKLLRHPEYDPQRRAIYAQNHVSMMDGHLACMAIPHAFCGLHNAWHFKIPAYGWIMKLACGIPVYPRSEGRTAEITAAAQNRVNELGISILAFPEAHRTKDGRMRDFKAGVFFIARDAGVPVVPMAVRGFGKVNKKGSWLFNPFQTVEIYFGKQLETEGLSDDEVRQLAVTAHDIMADWVHDGVLPEGAKHLVEAPGAKAVTA